MHAHARVIVSSQAALVGLALVALTLTACGPLSSATRTGSTATPDTSGSATLCVRAGPAGQDDDPTYCQRVVDDELRRSKLTPRQRAEAEAAAEAVGAAIDRMTSDCPQPVTEECMAKQARQRLFPTADNPEQTVDQTRETLTAAGFTDVVVRPAGQVDPAPRHAIVYAVSTGAGCVVGHLGASGRGGAQQQVLGVLPHGRCLA
ncbi:hypothetical protein ONA91_29090 [Micromonospora sp. DR5-3]|uniref:hypothetical protein n=1 Tax=unclassified Micromonospora TaxID=2617518 RepID=UPI0011D7A170|nr:MULTISPECIES: hypothetical protein [unclassified Micromonospora]MCW3818502.1 hypothetical protein [Micromonospora sp. DR5-3]TYC12773.1 hypothetical protein FXF52_40035 [Micromonospora sp. MP36]